MNTTENTTDTDSNEAAANVSPLFDESNRATYCPEDNRLRLYVGRVPRDEYEALRADGWTSTPKQDCDFVAHWTPSRRDTCLAYAGIIEDEDQSPEDRAADRAERFGGYLDKRIDDATGHADRYSSQPQAHGYQSEKRAERAAARHDRIADRAGDAWSKAEYWQRRTAGVISRALYVSRPDVRMGRIKELESLIRKAEKARDEYAAKREAWLRCSELTDPEKQKATASKLAYYEHGNYVHPRTGRKTYLYDLIQPGDAPDADPLTGAETCLLWLAAHGPLGEEGDWLTHYRMRLAYENQMLEAQGGRLASVEIEVGGRIGGKLVLKVNKSNATGRVTSVDLKGPKVQGWTYKARNIPGTEFAAYQFDTERMPPNAYTPPDDASRAELAELFAEKKAKAPKAATIPLINPTDDDAQRLQDALNERAKEDHCARHLRAYGRDYAEEFKPSTVCRITQAQYSAASKGAYARAETRGICRNMEIEPRASNMYSSREKEEEKRRGPKVCEVRTTSSDGSDYGARRVIVLTDKPQKPLPAAVWSLPAPEAPAFTLTA